MIFFCYNKGTKRKNETKNVSNFQNYNRGHTDAQISDGRKGSAKGSRDAAKKIIIKEGTKSDDSFPYRGGCLK